MQEIHYISTMYIHAHADWDPDEVHTDGDGPSAVTSGLRLKLRDMAIPIRSTVLSAGSHDDYYSFRHAPPVHFGPVRSAIERTIPVHSDCHHFYGSWYAAMILSDALR